MKLAALLNLEDQSLPNLDVKGITANSKDVEDGFVFFALKGVKTDGTAFINDAVQRGAVAVVSDCLGKIDTHICVVKVDDAHHALALAAAGFFNSQPATIAAVTGTSGKTSVVSFLRQIWAHDHMQAASIGTVGVTAPGIHHYGSLTTPDPISLMKLLKELNNHGVTHVAMEASSHGIDQKRLDGVKLTAAAFTNLGRDHMDYHPTVEDYFHAKMRLFDTLLPIGSPAVVYADDAYSSKAIEHIKQHKRDVLTVGQNGDFIKILKITRERSLQHLSLHFNGKNYDVTLPLAGDFQVANSIVAAGLALVTGVNAKVVFEALSLLKGAPGRLEQIGNEVNGALVYVDYAHKPDALENVLHSVRPFTKGKVVVVFGCGGDRDKGKRPLMGEIATRLADVVVVTDDNPRSEDPAQIRKEILTAAPKALEIGDRREAIHYAIDHLEQGDTLIIAGKGHEEGQIIGNKTIPFSDHREAEAAIKQRKNSGNF